MDAYDNPPQLSIGEPIPPSYAAKFPSGYLQEDRGYIIVQAAIFFIAIDTVMVTLRFAARWIQRSKFRIDDFLVIFGLIFCWALDTNYICSVLLGDDGRHIEYIVLYPERFAAHQKIAWISASIMFILASACSRLAVLYVYHSIFVSKRDLRGVKIVAGFIIISSIIEIPIPIFQCHPIHGLWDLSVDSTCVDKIIVIRYGPLPGIIIDLALMILPIPTIRTIQVPLRVKVGIFMTFFLGSIGLVVCIVRQALLFQPLDDPSWNSMPVILCNMAEATTYLMSACLLQIRPLLTFITRETPLARFRHWRMTQTGLQRMRDAEIGPRSDLNWNGSGIGLRTVAKPTSEDSTPPKISRKDGIVITNEFTINYDHQAADDDHQSEQSHPTRPIEQF